MGEGGEGGEGRADAAGGPRHAGRRQRPRYQRRHQSVCVCLCVEVGEWG